jgi:N-acetylmuramoyl-L-alanine amidase
MRACFVALLFILSGVCELSHGVPSPAPTPEPPFRVVIDPGHGGTDTGASYGAFKESELALQYGFKLNQRLKEDLSFMPHMTRDQNRNLSLTDRVKLAEEAQGELFVSLHLNASVDPRAQGALFFIQDHVAPPPKRKNPFAQGAEISAILSDLQEHSQRFLTLGYVKLLYSNWSNEIGIKKSETHSSVRQAPFYVVAKNKMPSVLIELGFLSNKKEAEKLSVESHQDKIVSVIHESLTKYREHFRKKSPQIKAFE